MSQFPRGSTNALAADLDNNGALDLIASGVGATAVRLQDSDGAWIEVTPSPALAVTALIDTNSDGLLDLIGISGQGGVTVTTTSPRAYTWNSIETVANPELSKRTSSSGDKRINP